MLYRLGKKPATRLMGVGMADDYATSRLLTPPSSVPVPKPVAGWGMLGNDTCGDCTFAGAAHLIMAVAADLAPAVAPPLFTTSGVVQEYSAVTGYDPQTGANDNGANENEVLELWRSKGLFGGHKILAYAPVSPTDVLALHRAIAFYGNLYIGIACPESAQQQFANAEPWTVVPGSPILGGHCILPVAYDPEAITCVTWGGLARVTWPFWATYCDEAHVVITSSEGRLQRGVGQHPLDLAALVADLDKLAA